MTRCDLRVGMIGLGALGFPIAANLRRADVLMRVHTRRRNRSLQGTIACATPADAAKGVDVLVVCVSDNAAVEAVLFGADGASHQLTAGSVVVDCSTIAPATAIACAQRLAQRGVHYLDAPVTGGTEGAKAGSLTVLVGGDPAALERARPVLEIIGGSIHHFGAVGRGQQVKAVNQVLVAGSYAAVAEAMALGQRLELPMDAVVTALQGGAAGSWALSHRANSMLKSSYPLGFRMSLHQKDLGIALDAAGDVNLDLPVTQLVADLENGLMEQGHGDEDVSALHRYYHTKS